MAAKKKRKSTARKSKKKAPARGGRSKRVKAPRAVAPPAGLKELDSEWKSFIQKSVPDVPLTEIWDAPKGAPSAKTTIAAATKALRKAAKKAAKKKRPGKRPNKKTGARKAPARRKTAKKK